MSFLPPSNSTGASPLSSTSAQKDTRDLILAFILTIMLVLGLIHTRHFLLIWSFFMAVYFRRVDREAVDFSSRPLEAAVEGGFDPLNVFRDSSLGWGTIYVILFAFALRRMIRGHKFVLPAILGCLAVLTTFAAAQATTSSPNTASEIESCSLIYSPWVLWIVLFLLMCILHIKSNTISLILFYTFALVCMYPIHSHWWYTVHEAVSSHTLHHNSGDMSLTSTSLRLNPIGIWNLFPALLSFWWFVYSIRMIWEVRAISNVLVL